MSYYFSKVLDTSPADAEARVTGLLAEQGFGILTEIDVKATMKKKLDKDIRPYRILGACNPSFALEALEAEHNIGAMLPCNVIVRQLEDGRTEVAAVDPAASMMAVENASLASVAEEVRSRLEGVIEAL